MMKIISKFSDKIKGSLSTFDRMIFKGHLMDFFIMQNRHYFLNQEKVLLKDFGAYAQKVTEEIKNNAKQIAESANRPYIYLNSPKIKKEKTALEIARKDQIQEGLICVLASVELCRSFEIRKNQSTGKLELGNGNRKCIYLYFYYLDEEFGFMHVRLQTWFPFEIQVYINGREYLARKMDHEGIEYTRYDNSFIDIADLEKAQELADQIESRKFSRTFDNFAERINPILKRITKIFSSGYYWCLDQCEYATDVMFKSRKDLEKIYPDLVEHATLCFNCEDVMTFLGRKLQGNFQGEIVSDRKRRPQGVRIKHRMKKNSIKMYDKYSVLRVETTINDPHEFKIYREVNRKNEPVMAWVPMGKSVANIYRYAQVSKSSNVRYLDALSSVEDTSEVVTELEAICNHVDKGSVRHTGFNPVSEESCKIFLAVLNGGNNINGFTNKDIRNALYYPAADGVEDHRLSNRTTRLLAKLRAHRLIAKIPHSFRYKLTKKGVRLMSAALKIKKKDFINILLVA